MNYFAENLRVLRARKNVSQEEMADSLKVDRKTISNWENNDTVPSFAIAIAIADYFGVSLDELVGRAYPVLNA